MLSKRPIRDTARATTASIFTGTRWRNFAQAFANRYRRIRRHTGLSLNWHRLSAGKRWVRKHWLPSSSVMNWQLNLNVKADIRERVREESYLFPERPHEGRPPLAAGQIFAPRPALPFISHHFLMQRMIHTQMLRDQQPMTQLTEHNVHTAVRPIVREKSRIEHTLVVKTVPGHNRDFETGVPTRKPATVVQMPPTAALPSRMPEINISQIADQVMRQLDHRISSWRERRGRN